jgi:hypothetical protein
MGRFWRTFLPYQLWRFGVINAKMYAISRGWIGPRHG